MEKNKLYYMKQANFLIKKLDSGDLFIFSSSFFDATIYYYYTGTGTAEKL